MELRFTISDDLSPAIDRALAALHDFSPAMRDISLLMEREVVERFDAGEGPDGKSWQPSQRVLERGGKTLIDTRRLLASIDSDYDATSALTGTNVIYAALNQLGGTIRAIPKSKGGKGALKTPFGPRGSVSIPARPFLGFGEVEQREIPQILADHLRAAFEGGAA